jgi:hypothetical protein
MADDRSKRGAADRDRINMNEEYEVRYWTQKWKVSPDQLAAAVHEVGVMVSDVAARKFEIPIVATRTNQPCGSVRFNQALVR